MNPLIEASDLELSYGRGAKRIRVLGPISFRVDEEGALGIIGESGAGKSTLALEILGLLGWRGGRRERGEISTPLRPDEIAYIPQDPLSALDPLFSVGSHLREFSRDARKIEEALAKVHLELGTLSLKSYPHELSGGMRQRLVIALALLRNPRLIVADEPTSSLDLILQAEIMDLFREIKNQGVPFLFITHNLPLAASFCDRVLVLQRGLIVEEGKPGDIFHQPRDPYTRALVHAVPRMRYRHRE